MLFLFVWLLFAAITAIVASSKNRSALAWGFFGAIFGIFALVVVAMLHRIPTDQERRAIQAYDDVKTCPRCAENVKSAAKVCRYCNHEFA